LGGTVTSYAATETVNNDDSEQTAQQDSNNSAQEQTEPTQAVAAKKANTDSAESAVNEQQARPQAKAAAQDQSSLFGEIDGYKYGVIEHTDTTQTRQLVMRYIYGSGPKKGQHVYDDAVLDVYYKRTATTNADGTVTYSPWAWDTSRGENGYHVVTKGWSQLPQNWANVWAKAKTAPTNYEADTSGTVDIGGAPVNKDNSQANCWVYPTYTNAGTTSPDKDSIAYTLAADTYEAYPLHTIFYDAETNVRVILHDTIDPTDEDSVEDIGRFRTGTNIAEQVQQVINTLIPGVYNVDSPIKDGKLIIPNDSTISTDPNHPYIVMVNLVPIREATIQINFVDDQTGKVIDSKTYQGAAGNQVRDSWIGQTATSLFKNGYVYVDGLDYAPLNSDGLGGYSEYLLTYGAKGSTKNITIWMHKYPVVTVNVIDDTAGQSLHNFTGGFKSIDIVKNTVNSEIDQQFTAYDRQGNAVFSAPSYVIVSDDLANVTTYPTENTTYTVHVKENIIDTHLTMMVPTPLVFQVDTGYLDQVAKYLPYLVPNGMPYLVYDENGNKVVEYIDASQMDPNDPNSMGMQLPSDLSLAKWRELESHIHYQMGTGGYEDSNDAMRIINNYNGAFSQLQSMLGYICGNNYSGHISRLKVNAKINAATNQITEISPDNDGGSVNAVNLPAGYKAQVIKYGAMPEPDDQNIYQSTATVVNAGSTVVQPAVNWNEWLANNTNLFDYTNALMRNQQDPSVDTWVQYMPALDSYNTSLQAFDLDADSDFFSQMSYSTGFFKANDLNTILKLFMSPLTQNIYNGDPVIDGSSGSMPDYPDGTNIRNLVTIYSIAPTEQTAKVEFVDDDNGGAVVGTTQTISGLTDSTKDLSSLHLTVPTNYALSSGQTIPTEYKFTGNANQVLQIHLIHQTTPLTTAKTVTRTIKVKKPNGTVITKVQTAHLTRTGIKDLVTGQTKWDDWSTDDSSWSQYKVPAVAGYNPSKSSVAAVVVDGNTTNQTITITYKKATKPAKPVKPVNPVKPNHEGESVAPAGQTLAGVNGSKAAAARAQQANAKLPQTGEKSSGTLLLLGLAMTTLVTLLGLVDRKRK
jgi:LPXTG-motif cell wall-anchored protein